jgi:pimeloyl-ACP methyl ester carboxylesterase
MPECAEGTMNLAGPSEPVDLLGHSMGGLCALAFALGDPERVRRLVLVCSGSGGPIIRRAKGWPANHCLTDFDFRRLTYWGFRGVLVAGPARTAARSG